jgi:hypothetical protein
MLTLIVFTTDKFYRFDYDLKFKAINGQINIVLDFIATLKHHI